MTVITPLEEDYSIGFDLEYSEWLEVDAALGTLLDRDPRSWSALASIKRKMEEAVERAIKEELDEEL